MPTLTCYVDDRTFSILVEYGQRHGRKTEELAEAAIADAALRTLPPPGHSEQLNFKKDVP